MWKVYVRGIEEFVDLMAFHQLHVETNEFVERELIGIDERFLRNESIQIVHTAGNQSRRELRRFYGTYHSAW